MVDRPKAGGAPSPIERGCGISALVRNVAEVREKQQAHPRLPFADDFSYEHVGGQLGRVEGGWLAVRRRRRLTHLGTFYTVPADAEGCSRGREQRGISLGEKLR